MRLNDPVLFRRHPGDHWKRGTIFGYCKSRTSYFYDVRDEDGEGYINITDVRLDESAMQRIREAEGVA